LLGPMLIASTCMPSIIQADRQHAKRITWPRDLVGPAGIGPGSRGDSVGWDLDRGGQLMGILTDDMKRLIDEQKLAFHATVCPDGSPNLSPKGSTRVWDDDHLFFADVCSPQTTANIRAGSLVEVNVVDPFVRKGYRFKGQAVIHERGSAAFAEGV